MVEQELKAVVSDPPGVRARLLAAGARPGFAGLMRDRRFDHDGRLLARGEVLRVRDYQRRDGTGWAELTWKGPTLVEGGYKTREERGTRAESGPELAGVLAAVGFAPVYAIDRYVECFALGEAAVRLEWYPRMDPLVEVEGPPPAIEAAVAATGIPRREFSAEELVRFVERFRARGERAAVSLDELGGDEPGWPR